MNYEHVHNVLYAKVNARLNSMLVIRYVSLCETTLNESIEIPDPLLNDYTFIAANHPDNVTHGDVELFCKISLPLKLRNDLAFRESIVVEHKFGRKKMFFTVIYRSPSFKYSSIEFNDFISNSKVVHTKIQAENTLLPFILEISMVIPNFGGPMGVTPLKVRKLKKCSHY